MRGTGQHFTSGQMLEGTDGAHGQPAFPGPFVLLPQRTPGPCVGFGQREVLPVLKRVLCGRR